MHGLRGRVTKLETSVGCRQNFRRVEQAARSCQARLLLLDHSKLFICYLWKRDVYFIV